MAMFYYSFLLRDEFMVILCWADFLSLQHSFVVEGSFTRRKWNGRSVFFFDLQVVSIRSNVSVPQCSATSS